MMVRLPSSYGTAAVSSSLARSNSTSTAVAVARRTAKRYGGVHDREKSKQWGMRPGRSSNPARDMRRHDAIVIPELAEEWTRLLELQYRIASSSLAVKRLTERLFLIENDQTDADLTVAGVERARDNLTEARRELGHVYATIAAHEKRESERRNEEKLQAYAAEAAAAADKSARWITQC